MNTDKLSKITPPAGARKHARRGTASLTLHRLMLLLLLLVGVGEVTAANTDYAWTFGEAQSLTQNQTYTFTANGATLSYVAGSSCKVENSTATIGGVSYTTSLKMGGKTQTSKGSLTNRYFKFNAPSAKGKLTVVYANNSSNSAATLKSGETTLATVTGASDAASTSSEVTTTKDAELSITFDADKAYIYSIIWTATDGTETTTYTVSASATNGSVSIVDGSNNAVTSGSSVAAGTKLVFTATPNTGYTFSSWTATGTQGTANGSTYTISSLTANTTVTANFTKDSGSETATTLHAWSNGSTTAGTTELGSSLATAQQNSKTVIKVGANYDNTAATAIAIKPTSGTFKAGDVVSITLWSTKTGTLNLFSSLADKEAVSSLSATSTEKTITITLDEDADVLYIGRQKGSSTIYVSDINVTRAAQEEGKTALVPSLSSHSATYIISSPTQTGTLPTLTVKAGDTQLTADTDYTVTIASDNDDVAKVENNGLTIGTTAGVAHITYTVTPTETNKDKYSAAKATYTVTARAATPLSVSATDITINTIDQSYSQPTVNVYDADGNKLTLGTDYTLTFTIKEGATENFLTVNDNSGKPTLTVSGTAGAWTKGTATLTATATPTASLKGYTAGTNDFNYSVVEGKLTPKFLSEFSTMTIKVKAGSSATTTVPVVYDGSDISDYFTYTYSIVTSGAKSTVTKSGKYVTFKGGSGDSEVEVKVTAEPTTVDKIDYSEVYDKPADLTFKVKVSSEYTTTDMSIDPATINISAGETSAAPDVTVTDESKNTLASGYSLYWLSFSPNVATVDQDGTIHGISEGTAEIHVVLVGDKLQSNTTKVTVNVDDPAVFRVRPKDNNGNTLSYKRNESLWNSERSLRVTLGGWMFPNTHSVSSDITKETLGDTNKNWGGSATTAKWKLSGFDYYVSGTSNDNARQEDGSNSQPQSIYLYGSNTTGDIATANKGTVVDPMFNVPCSGSYLVFSSPKPGTVTVHIFQNGVFDKSGNTQYRPQRRVFVLDEAGNLVPTTAKIGTTTGKPGGGYTLSAYTWDLNNNTAPTEEEVKSHFVGLNSFTMSETGFKNGVYESNLTYDVCKNELLQGTDTKDVTGKGYRGWSVLADAPVTYTFATKPGKTYYLYNYGSKIGFYGFSFDEQTAVTVDNVELKQDAASQNIQKTEDGHVASVSIDRTFKGGIWNAAVLPFSMNKQQVDAIFGTTYSTGNTEGTQIIYFDHVEGNTCYFKRHAYNTLVAGKPFLIKPAKTGDITINTASVDDFPYVTIENTQPADWCAGADFKWVSSYANATIETGDYYIGSTSGNLVRRTSSSVTAKGFRGFLKAVTASAKQQVLVIENDDNTGADGEATAITELVMDGDGGFLERPLTGRVYNVNGQMVASDAAQFDALPAGIYIVNGKKYVK